MQSLFAAFPRSALATLIPLALALVSYTDAYAQQQTRAERDLAARERQLRGVGKAIRIENDIAQPRVTLGQVKQDYVGLQQANNAILSMLAQKNGLDYKVIEEAASEIKKRAGRLKSYMLTLQMVRENENRRKSLLEIETKAIKESLLSLDSTIARLIENPIFKNFNRVVDADGALKARDDLDDIIDLSEGIKRSARRALKLSRASR
ncbi:MAG TPA: hypothetical protein VEQ40_05670 [Pyrinomonadaceae bacterium]|nr:hypothetical protein [Pyrinomonadaceae bacterium]